MEWYYAQNNERLGPVSDEELVELQSDRENHCGHIGLASGWSEWRNWRDAGAGTPESGNVACVEICRKPFPMTEIIQYEGAWVCPTCKPIFFNAFSEGVPVAQGMHYAGFWIRVAAKIVDGIILQVVNLPWLFYWRRVE